MTTDRDQTATNWHEPLIEDSDTEKQGKSVPERHGPAIEDRPLEDIGTELLSTDKTENTGLQNSADKPLPPLPGHGDQGPSPASETPASPGREQTDPHRRMARRLHSASSASLIIFVGALIGFGGGILAGILVLTGTVDIDAPWVQAIMNLVRGG